MFGLVRQGLTNPQIAERLNMRLETVKHHVSQILSKLEVSSREEIISWVGQPAAGRWTLARVALAIGASAVTAAAVAGLALLAWGVSESGDGTEGPGPADGEDEPLQLVYADASSNLNLINSDGTERRQLGAEPQYCQSLWVFEWSQDGQYLACAQASDEYLPWIKVVDLDGNVTTDFVMDPDTFSWSPTGTRYAYTLASDLDASLSDLFVGRPTDSEAMSVAFASNPVWLPDGRLAAYRPVESSIGPEPYSGVDIYTGNEAHFIPVGDYRPLAAVRGSDALLVGGNYIPDFGTGVEYEAWILDLASEELTRVPELDDQPRIWIAPGGALGIFVLVGNPEGELWVIDFDSLDVHAIPNSTISAPKDSVSRRHIAFSPDGATVYWADARYPLPLDLYRAPLAGGATEQLASIPDAGAVDFAPDFSRIAYIVPGGDLWTAKIDGSDARSVGQVLNAFAWRPNSSTSAEPAACEPTAPDEKQGPLAIGFQQPNTLCWRDAEGETSYKIEGSVRYWSLSPAFDCATSPPPILWLSAETPFSEILPADSTRFQLPEPSDSELTDEPTDIKEFHVELRALDAEGGTIVFDGTAVTKDPPLCEPSSSQEGLKLPDSDSPAAGVCPGPADSDIVTVEMQLGVPSPRCVRVLPSHRIRVVNRLDQTITVELGEFRADLAPGEEATSPPVGEFLASGVHVIQSDAYGGGGSGEVWVGDYATPQPTVTS